MFQNNLFIFSKNFPKNTKSFFVFFKYRYKRKTTMSSLGLTSQFTTNLFFNKPSGEVNRLLVKDGQSDSLVISSYDGAATVKDIMTLNSTTGSEAIVFGVPTEISGSLNLSGSSVAINTDASADFALAPQADAIAIGAGASSIIIGGVNSSVNIHGILNTISTTNTDVKDSFLTLNKGGVTASASETGIGFEENGQTTGFVKTSAARTSIDVKAPANSSVVALEASGVSIYADATKTAKVMSVSAASSVVSLSNGTRSAAIAFPSVDSQVILSEGAQTINGDKTLSGATQLNTFAAASGAIATDLTVGRDASITRDLSVTGKTTLANELDVTGASRLRSTLVVDGASQLKSTLAVDGALTAASASTLSGAVSMGSTLAVAGKATLADQLDVTGASRLRSALVVDGASELKSTVAVTGAATLSDTLAVSEDATFAKKVSSATLDVSVNASMTSADVQYGAFNAVNGNAATSAVHSKISNADGQVLLVKKDSADAHEVAKLRLTSDGSALTAHNSFGAVTSELTQSSFDMQLNRYSADGIKNFSLNDRDLRAVIQKNSSDGSLSSKLTLGSTGQLVAEAVDMITLGAPTLYVSDPNGSTLLSGTLSVARAAALNSTMAVTGATTLSDTLSVAEDATFAKKVASATLDVSGAATLGSTLDVTGALTAASASTLSGAVSMGSTLNVTGMTNLSGGVQGTNANFFRLNALGGASLGSTLIDGTLTVRGPAAIQYNLAVNGPATMDSTLGVTGKATLADELDVTGASRLRSALAVDGASELKSTLAVTGAAQFASNASFAEKVVVASTYNPASLSDAAAAFKCAGGATIAQDLYTGGSVYNPSTQLMTISSDKRIKHSIEDADVAACIDSITAVKLRTYKFSDKYAQQHGLDAEKEVLGVVADELQQTHPDSVVVKREEQVGDEKFEDFKTVNLTRQIYELIGCVQYLTKRMKQMEAQLV
jgi:hypothetical protein